MQETKYPPGKLGRYAVTLGLSMKLTRGKVTRPVNLKMLSKSPVAVILIPSDWLLPSLHPFPWLCTVHTTFW